tara:strand:- start:2034 stop:2393 length:360 start_codon:yes stop_codon:yes gene_type:complete
MSRKYNGGEWTKARWKGFIMSALRKAWLRWPPRNRVKKAAWVRRGVYKCNGCKKNVRLTKIIDGKRKNNISIDHIKPVIPAKGFSTWDSVISRMFCEENNLQLLCKDCHDSKTKEERSQ